MRKVTAYEAYLAIDPKIGKSVVQIQKDALRSIGLDPDKLEGMVDEIFGIMKWGATGPGVLYPLLMKLEGKGLVRSEWAEGPYPRRRLYTLATPTHLDEVWFNHYLNREPSSHEPEPNTNNGMELVMTGM